jgi:NitT/TauT family transport system ATP-binding protein
MTPRPGRIGHEIASPLRPGAAARFDPAYAALVAQVTRDMQRALAA